MMNWFIGLSVFFVIFMGVADSVLKIILEHNNDKKTNVGVLLSSISLLITVLVYICVLGELVDSISRWISIVPLIAFIYVLEIFRIKHKKVIGIIVRHWMFGLFLLAATYAGYYYIDGNVESEISRLTKVSASNFTVFYIMLSGVLISVGLLAIMKVIFLLIGFFYLYKSVFRNDIYTEFIMYATNFIIFSVVWSSVIVNIVFKDVIPYMENVRFVQDVFHENKDFFGEPICTNVDNKLAFDKEKHIALLSNGEVLVYMGMREIPSTKDNKKYKPVFVPQKCSRNKTIKTS